MVRLQIQHVLEYMAEVPDPSGFQIVEYPGNSAPLRDLRIRLGISLQCSQNEVRSSLPHANSNTGELRNCTEIVVAKLHVGRAPLVIHGLHRLQSYKDYRYTEIPNDDSEGG